ncbi:MAG TPA: hypothetical protein VMH82_04190 [Myxococcota bacterium]|nr:hypothetical protein [Myxococcota bacterium]
MESRASGRAAAACAIAGSLLLLVGTYLHPMGADPNDAQAALAAGVAIAYTGFSGLAMAINMPANSLLLVWMLLLGGFMWRRSS